jgi:hypothetical protein
MLNDHARFGRGAYNHPGTEPEAGPGTGVAHAALAGASSARTWSASGAPLCS